MKRFIILATIALVSSSLFARYMNDFDAQMAQGQAMFSVMYQNFMAEEDDDQDADESTNALTALNSTYQLRSLKNQWDNKLVSDDALAEQELQSDLIINAQDNIAELQLAAQENQFALTDTKTKKYRESLTRDNARSDLRIGKWNNWLAERKAARNAKTADKAHEVATTQYEAQVTYAACLGMDGNGSELEMELAGGSSVTKLARACRAAYPQFDTVLGEATAAAMAAYFQAKMSAGL